MSAGINMLRRIHLSLAALALVICAFLPQGAIAEGYWVPGFGSPGMNGRLWALCTYGNDLIAVGAFTSVGGVPCNNVARWDGSSWSPLGGGVNGQVNAVVVWNGLLVVGGAFSSASGVSGTANLAAWNGSTWQTLGGGVDDWVYGLCDFGGDLIVGGKFTSAGGVGVNYVARWNGTDWAGMGLGFTEGDPLPSVWCFAEYDGHLIAGGRFSKSGSTVVNRVARWSGTVWESLGQGVGGTSLNSVYDMCVFSSELVAGGWFTLAGDVSTRNLARWDGTSWSGFAPGLDDGGVDVAALYEYEGKLYVGGGFAGVTGVPETANLARWTGTSWDAIAHPINGFVDDFCAYGANLILCGAFTEVNGLVENRIAIYNDSNVVLQIQDVPSDQGGFLDISWYRHRLDDPMAGFQVTSYDIQLLNETWAIIATTPAVATASYSVQIATNSVLVGGQPEPYVDYRIVARTADPATFFESPPVSGYSIDNLPPPKPDASMLEELDSRTILWTRPTIPDFGTACVHRGSEADFTAGEPVACPSTRYFEETDLGWYFYRVQFSDIHGNLSEFSDELHGQWPTPVPGAVPTALRLYPCQPNPFNPRTTIKYDLPEAGSVRLSVFDVSGRLVRTLVDDSMPQGSHEAAWDGRDASGREVGSGSYLARLEFRGKAEVVRMGLVR